MPHSYIHLLPDFRQLCSLFPFPSGGNPNDDQAAEAATELLKEIKQGEEAGIRQLEVMLREVS